MPTETPPCSQYPPWEDLHSNPEMWCSLSSCMGWVEVFLGGEALV